MSDAVQRRTAHAPARDLRHLRGAFVNPSGVPADYADVFRVVQTWFADARRRVAPLT